MKTHRAELDAILELLRGEHAGIGEIAQAIRSVPPLRTFLVRRAVRTSGCPDLGKVERLALLLGTRWLEQAVQHYAEGELPDAPRRQPRASGVDES